MTRKKYCGTAAKAGGNGENKPRPKVMGGPRLLEKSYKRILGCLLFAAIFTFSIKSAEAEQYIIEDGKANAEIVVAEVSPRMTTLAALELHYYLEKISGAKVPIVFEKTDANNIKIYVGKSKYTDEMGIDDKNLYDGAIRMISGKDYLVLLGYDSDFKPSTTRVEWNKETEEFVNVKIDSIEKNNKLNRHQRGDWWRALRYKGSYEEFMINRYGKENSKVWNLKGINLKRGTYFEYEEKGYIPGFFKGDRSGSFNAVSSFLRRLGVRWYMPGEIGQVIPELKTIALPEVNKTYKPDHSPRAWLTPSYTALSFEHVMWTRWLGLETKPHKQLGTSWAHGLVQVHKSKDMQEKHPEYYALRRGKRLTGGSHGAVCFSSEGFYRTTLKYVRFMFDVNDAPHVSLWPADGFKHCHCENCKNISSSDLVWGFVDKVAREIYKTHPDRIISCAAYTPYIHPPTNVKKFTPNVVVVISNSGRIRFDDPVVWNKYTTRVEGFKEKLDGKRMIRSENIMFHKVTPVKFPVIHPRNIVKDMKYRKDFCFAEMGERTYAGGTLSAPGCDHLTLYMNARFAWDVDQDLEKVLAEYYDKFYGPAAEAMKTALDFAEAKYSRTDRSKNGGGCDPRNVSLPTRIKLLELLHKAKGIADDTIYGKRVDIIIGELPDLKKSREELKTLQEKGNPRDDAIEITATNLKSEEKPETYKLLRTTLRRKKPEIDTTFNVKWTEKSLTFEVRSEEPDMGSIKVGEKVWEGDSIVLLLESPYHSYYQIEVSPDGRIFDADRWGSIVEKWSSLADVKVEKDKDYWTATITVPIAIVGEEGAEGDPMNYVVSPRIKPGQEWFFNLGRRHPRKDGSSEKANRQSLKRIYVLAAGGSDGRSMLGRDAFSKLIFK